MRFAKGTPKPQTDGHPDLFIYLFIYCKDRTHITLNKTKKIIKTSKTKRTHMPNNTVNFSMYEQLQCIKVNSNKQKF